MKSSRYQSKFKSNNIILIHDICLLDESSFRKKVCYAVKSGKRLRSFFAVPKNNKETVLYAIFGDNIRNTTYIYAFISLNNTFTSLTDKLPQFNLFEREIYENTGIFPIGHPCLKPVRFPEDSIGDMDFFRINSNEIHQVAVGPVHAGIIEPGHFRFQCHGETVHHLEISLGYQHRGIEKKMISGPHKQTLHQIEVAAGDSTIAHTTAYCRILENLTQTPVPIYAEKIRAIALELERCANHIGDLGAMAGDIGYLPTMSFCGRIRGDFLNMTALICGNRFGRNLIVPGGVKNALDDNIIIELQKRLLAGKADFLSATSILWDTPSVLARFEDTGIVERNTACEIGMVGVAARASGLQIDSRTGENEKIYRNSELEIPVMNSGDVFARARIRWIEVQESIKIIENLIDNMEIGDLSSPLKNEIQPETLAVSMVEGWRGEICHVALSYKNGQFSKYKIIDPSFHNWLGLALAMRGEQISDFPICNKSFSLSYCGFDL